MHVAEPRHRNYTGNIKISLLFYYYIYNNIIMTRIQQNNYYVQCMYVCTDCTWKMANVDK